ncbi:MAG: DHH family phosphoesterase [Kiritimatiellia bacterium]
MSGWIEKPVDAAKVEALAAEGLSALQARLLALRGVTPATLGDYLNPTLEGLAAPGELPQVEAAAERILDFVRARRRIVVFGDYDCDGVCATAILYAALEALAPGVCGRFLPDRLTEGYGMSAASVARMRADEPNVALVVTVDNGINSVDCIAALKASGVEVIVTDHHLAGDEKPDCLIVNPKVAAPAHLEGLCGAGVAFMLANALIRHAKDLGLYRGPNVGGPMLVLAGLATVTDIMPILGQNRILVAEALRRFRKWAPLGLRELYERASRTGTTTLTSRDFGFLIGPRINAAGRIASGCEALDLVLASDRERARELARRVDVHNATRKTIEQAMTERALAQVVPGAPAQVIDLVDGHQGVAGIVASRVLEKLAPEGQVPVCVVVGGHGSARAPAGYNVRDAFEASAVALDRFGGHAAAGGFSVREGQIDRFRALFCAACARQAASSGAAHAGVEMFDACVSGADLSFDFVSWLNRMEPFGEGNPEPVFVLRNVYLADVRPLGAEGRHLQISLRGRDLPRAVWWHHGALVERLRAEAASPHDLMFTAEISDYGGPHVELRLLSLHVVPTASVLA